MKDSINVVKGAVKIVRDNLIEDENLYNALVASIESAIYDDRTVCDLSDQHNLAVEIADRIIGI